MLNTQRTSTEVLNRVRLSGDVSFGLAEIEDIEAVTGLMLALKQEDEGVAVTPEVYSDVASECKEILSATDVVVILARVSGEVVGQVMMRATPSRTMMVFGLYVKPEHRSKGIGVKFVQLSVETTRNAGYTTAEWFLSPDNPAGLYERLGARMTGKVYALEV